jgi:DNA-binding PadR family transcriptional regulator
MDAVPLCPIVLLLLAVRPRRAHEVATELRVLGVTDGAYGAVHSTLLRLQAARLVRAREGGRSGTLFMATARGRRELALQRLIVARTAQGRA